MKCVKPFVSRMGAFGCGQCLPCRVTARRTWAHRIQLEAMCHAENAFVTLTHSEDKVREVDPRELQLWLKRLRRSIYPNRVRHFSCAEYGDISERPHYHSALFGYPSCRGGATLGGFCQCPACSVVRSTWPYGFVTVGQLTEKSANYIAGYVTKKMTHRSDTRLRGRHPEFARMSLKPGIGADALHDVASAILQYRSKDEDVPVVLQWSKTSVKPLGKYLRRRLRLLLGKDEKAPASSLQALSNQMQILRAFAWENDRSVSSVFAELFDPYERTLAARLQLKQRTI
ncbi:replication initiator protein [Blackfly microvirus SF02]|uniref:Replication initiator protein n=1 Tax=Blackfly microvirus SF02 TaxID=2576452 RepID=A0A4P8PKM6_9VIRU|nr:replication initiator protein [Blackfly microvirus SF02]